MITAVKVNTYSQPVLNWSEKIRMSWTKSLLHTSTRPWDTGEYAVVNRLFISNLNRKSHEEDQSVSHPRPDTPWAVVAKAHSGYLADRTQFSGPQITLTRLPYSSSSPHPLSPLLAVPVDDAIHCTQNCTDIPGTHPRHMTVRTVQTNFRGARTIRG